MDTLLIALNTKKNSSCEGLRENSSPKNMRAAEVEFASTRQKWEWEDRAGIQYGYNISKLRQRMNMGQFDTKTRTNGTPKYMMWGNNSLSNQ